MHTAASPDGNERGRSHPVPGRWTAALHLLALWTFAVAQPTLDLIGRHPDFLVAQRLTGVPLVVLAVGGALFMPALLSLPLLMPRLGTGLAARYWTNGVRALLAAAFILQLLHPLPAGVALALAAIAGVGVALCLNRFRG